MATSEKFQQSMIPINKPWIDEEEKKEVANVLEENALTTAARDGGKRVREFENLLRDYLKVKHAIAVNSGTAALHAALLAAGVKEGDEVLIPSFTFVATANAVVAAGAKPVFVDVDSKNYTMDVSDLKAKITEKSRIILPVHLYGHPADMDKMTEVADQNSLGIIEDACQSLGSTCKNKQTGTFGTMGCFSLYASKVLTAGEGGAVVTNDDRMADHLKMIRNHGMVEGYDTRVFGLNLRLPELSAAVAKVQMKKLPRMLELRRRNAKLLTELVSAKGVGLPSEAKDTIFNWYLYTVAFERDGIRDAVQKGLADSKIGATVYYNPPVHKTPYYEKLSPNTRLEKTEWCASHVLSLPVHPSLSESDVQRVADTFNKECSKVTK